MARIEGLKSKDASLGAKIGLYFTRKGLGQISGHTPENPVEPLEMYAHVPGLMKGYGRHEQAVGKLKLLDKRHRALAELKAATMTECEWCIDLGSQIARQWGLTDEELLSLANYRSADCFSELDVAVLDYAAAMSSTPVEVSDENFALLKRHFDTPQLVELTHIIALENLRGRFNLALDIAPAGFSENRVCALPETAGRAAA